MLLGLKNLQSKKILRYKIKKELSNGSFSVVYLAEYEGKSYALKKMNKTATIKGNEIKDHFFNEITALKKLDHPNIVKFYDVLYDENGLDVLVMEYVSYNLQRFIGNESYKELVKVNHKNWLRQIASALEYLHSNRFIHGDLKPSNILFDDNILKIADFGLSVELSRSKTNLVATLLYTAPEIMLGKKDYGTDIDIWSLGCVASEMICESLLFKEKTEIKMLDSIFTVLGFPAKTIAPQIRYLNEMKHHSYKLENILKNKGCSDQQIVFLKQFFIYEPDKRATAKKVLDSEYLNE